MSAEEKKTVKRLAIFIGVFYGKYFLETSISQNARGHFFARAFLVFYCYYYYRGRGPVWRLLSLPSE